MKILTLSLIVAASALQVYAQNTFTTMAGKCKVVLLSEGQGQGNASILVGATPEMLKKCIPEGTFPNACNVFLVQTPDKKNILIDAGYGKLLEQNLKEQGLTPGDIDAVLLTHMHPDHIGGLVKEGAVAFPKAEIHVSDAELAYWTQTNPNPLAMKVNELYRERIKTFTPTGLRSGDNVRVLSIFRAVSLPGHTPGHCGFMLVAQQRILFWGDITHAMAIQMPFPQVAVTYDSDPEEAVKSRKQAFSAVIANQIPVAGAHIPYPGMGTIARDEKGRYVFTPMQP